MKNSVFLPPSDLRLYEVSKEVPAADIKKAYVKNICKKMREVAGANQVRDKNKAVMVGLAAPQIGFQYRIVFVDMCATRGRNHQENNNIFMINPVIISKSRKLVNDREGCFLAMSEMCSFHGMVLRSEKVKVRYLSEGGEEVTQEFEGFTARIIQHEVDHLNGKVFVHSIKKEKDLHIVFDSECKDYGKKFATWKRTLNPKIYFSDVVKRK
jgi:peptide deformylase